MAIRSRWWFDAWQVLIGYSKERALLMHKYVRGGKEYCLFALTLLSDACFWIHAYVFQSTFGHAELTYPDDLSGTHDMSGLSGIRREPLVSAWVRRWELDSRREEDEEEEDEDERRVEREETETKCEVIQTNQTVYCHNRVPFLFLCQLLSSNMFRFHAPAVAVVIVRVMMSNSVVVVMIERCLANGTILWLQIVSGCRRLRAEWNQLKRD